MTQGEKVYEKVFFVKNNYSIEIICENCVMIVWMEYENLQSSWKRKENKGADKSCKCVIIMTDFAGKICKKLREY